MGKRTDHQETSNVLMMSVERCFCGVIHRHKHVRVERVHVLSYQRGDDTQRSQSKAKLEVQRVVDGVVETGVTITQSATKGSAFRGTVSCQNLADAVTNTPVGTVHVARHNKDHRDREVVVGHIGQPQRLSLGMEATQERENRCTRTFTGAKHMACRVSILSINTPVTGKEGR